MQECQEITIYTLAITQLERVELGLEELIRRSRADLRRVDLTGKNWLGLVEQFQRVE